MVKSASTILYLFIAALAPAITFGSRFLDGTNGQFGVLEMIMSTAISGMLFSGSALTLYIKQQQEPLRTNRGTFAGQPLSILGATGPFLAYTLVVYDLGIAMNLEFMPLYFWTCMWCAFFTILVALFDLCALMKHVTMFSEDIFAGLISLIFIIDGIRPIIQNFSDGWFGGTSSMPLVNAMFEALLFLYTFGPFSLRVRVGLASYLSHFRRTPWLLRPLRNLFANFAVTISLETNLRMLNVEAELEPALTLSTGAKRPWIVNPMGIETEFPVWGIFFAILPAVGFAVLGYLDQNLTSVIVQQLPQGERKVPVKVVEQRATNFLIHVLIGCALFLAPVLKFLPRSVLQGVFFYMGIASLTGNNLFDRLFLWLVWEPKQLGQPRGFEQYTRDLSCKPALFQATSVVFPFFMASLAIIRKALRFMFTAEELKYLDSYPDAEEEEALEPQPDLENLGDLPEDPRVAEAETAQKHTDI
eukprot:g18317.t1